MNIKPQKRRRDYRKGYAEGGVIDRRPDLVKAMTAEAMEEFKDVKDPDEREGTQKILGNIMKDAVYQ